MEFLIAFVLFMASMIICLSNGISMAISMFVGFVCFFIAACVHGCKPKTVLKAAFHGIKETSSVLTILLLVGCLTAAWRMSGVIAFFVYYGVSKITPQLFLVLAFILTSIISYALGTSVGTTATAGVILMAIARSGGINEVIAAGVICAGTFFGDRTSPAASSSNLMATLTHTDLYGNVKRMLKTSILPMIFCIIAYSILSFQNPLQAVDYSILNSISTDFHITIWLIIPVAIMLILPLFKVKVKLTIIISTLSACILAIIIQDMNPIDTIKSCFLGYYPTTSALQTIWQGGGAISMLEIIIILLIASTFASIVNECDAMKQIDNIIESCMNKLGREITVIIYSMLCVCIFCSQLISSMVAVSLLDKTYKKHNLTKEDLALDLENSLVIFSPMIPWSLSCSAPLKILEVGVESVLFDYLLFAIPVFYFVGIAIKRITNKRNIKSL